MFGQQTTPRTQGDLAILRFSMLAEVVAADIWSQMSDMMSANAAMRTAFSGIDPLLPRIVTEIARNERSHAEFLTALYNSRSGQPAMSVAQYQTLPTGATIGSAVCAANASVAAGGPVPRPGSGTGTGTGTGTGKQEREQEPEQGPEREQAVAVPDRAVPSPTSHPAKPAQPVTSRPTASLGRPAGLIQSPEPRQDV